MKEYSVISDRHLSLREKRRAVCKLLLKEIEIEGVIERNMPAVRAFMETIDGQKKGALFFVDTGSAVTMITSQIANDLGLNFDPTNVKILESITGEVETTPVIMDIRFEGKSKRSDRAVIIEIPGEVLIPNPEQVNPRIFPVIGSNIWSKFDEFNVSEESVTLNINLRRNSRFEFTLTKR